MIILKAMLSYLEDLRLHAALVSAFDRFGDSTSSRSSGTANGAELDKAKSGAEHWALLFHTRSSKS